MQELFSRDNLRRVGALGRLEKTTGLQFPTGRVVPTEFCTAGAGSYENKMKNWLTCQDNGYVRMVHDFYGGGWVCVGKEARK